jgi:hypothetical protein
MLRTISCLARLGDENDDPLLKRGGADSGTEAGIDDADKSADEGAGGFHRQFCGRASSENFEQVKWDAVVSRGTMEGSTKQDVLELFRRALNHEACPHVRRNPAGGAGILASPPSWYPSCLLSWSQVRGCEDSWTCFLGAEGCCDSLADEVHVDPRVG